MRAAKVIAVVVLAALGASLALRAASTLPSLAERPQSFALTDTGDTRLGRAIAPRVARHPGQSGILALSDGPGAFAARALMMRAAERSIDAQYYIWSDDLTGTLLFDELRAAAERGVRVRLLQDDNTTEGLDATLAALNSHPNIEVRLFNPFVIRSPRFVGFLTDFPRLNRRMHNKSLTVDNQATIVGGRNIGDAYFGAGEGAAFADLDVLAVGPVVGEVSRQFDQYWASASAYPASRILPAAPDGAIGAVAARADEVARDPAAQQYLAAVRDLAIVDQLTGGTLPLDWTQVRMVTDHPAKGLGLAEPAQFLISRLDDILEAPSERLALVSAYFVPTAQGEAAFGALARRGVKVDILTNSLAATDVPLVHAGYAPYRKGLLAAGVKLWELKKEQPGSVPGSDVSDDGGAASGSGGSGSGSSGSAAGGGGTALHAKTFAVDGERVFVGSFNFDPRSARLNTELGFVIRSPSLARRIDEGLWWEIPRRAYEVRLTPAGELVWIERVGGREARHSSEPGTSPLQRAWVKILSLLPIEWLL